MIFLTLLAIPVLVALVFFLFSKHHITLYEFLLHVAAQAAIAGVSVAFLYWQDTADTEVWNGRVADKKKVRVSCSHSYSCNCITSCSGSGKTRSCTTICQTCYEHSWDYDWMVYTTNKESIEINRINRQGTLEPPRWTAVKVGEPTSVSHSYTNYIKAAPDTLFRRQGLVEAYKDKLPTYPQKVYDYYRLDRLVGAVVMPERWNAALSELNADLGAAKQVNVVLVIARGFSPEYGQALEQHWLGGKKNDVVTVLGVSNEDAIDWVHVSAWTDSQMFKVKLRDNLLEQKKLDQESIFAILRQTILDYYIRKPMKDFEYLAASVTPTPTQWVVSMVIGILISIGLGFVFVHNEVV